MAVRLTRASNLPIGVDVGSASVTLAQLRLGDHYYQLISAASAELDWAVADGAAGTEPAAADRESALVDTIRRLLSQNVFKGPQCILSLPACDAFVQHLKIPKDSYETLEELDRAVRWELVTRTPHFAGNPAEANDAVVRHVMIGHEVYEDGQPKDEAIAFCVTQATMQRYLDVTRQAKLQVVGVSVESCAIVECFSRLFRRAADIERTFMFVDLGASSTQVVISQGPRLLFARNLDHGGRNLDAAVADATGATPAEAHEMRIKARQANADEQDRQHLQQCMEAPLAELAAMMGQCLDYYESVIGDRHMERVVFVGGGAYDRWLCNELALRLNLPGQIGNPLLGVRSAGGSAAGQADGRDGGAGAAVSRPDWTVAVGLSVGAYMTA